MGNIKDFPCDQCPKSYAEKKNLRHHQSLEHGRQKRGSKCAMCDEVVTTVEKYRQHLLDIHKILIDVETIAFSNREDFLAWKEAVEKAGYCYYYMKSKGKQCIYYECNRSGIHRSYSKGQRHPKRQGPRKINARCPAGMKVTTLDGVINVTHFKSHIGHELDLQHISIHTKDKCQLASYISMGIPIGDILQTIKSSRSDEPTSRVQLTTRQDLKNIKRAYTETVDKSQVRNELASASSPWTDDLQLFSLDTTGCNENISVRGLDVNVLCNDQEIGTLNLKPNICNQSADIEEAKRSLLEDFMTTLNKCTTIEEVHTLQTLIQPLNSTANSVQLSSENPLTISDQSQEESDFESRFLNYSPINSKIALEDNDIQFDL